MKPAMNCLAQLAIATVFLAGCKKEGVSDAGGGGKGIGGGSSVLQPSANQQPSIDALHAGLHASEAQQKRRRIMDDIAKIIGKSRDGFTYEHWRKIKDHYWMPGFDRVIGDAGSMAGVRKMLASPKGKEPLVVQLLTGVFDTQVMAEQDALLALHNMALATAATGGASLPSALADRRDDPNITQGDIIMFEVFDDAFQDVRRTKTLSQGALKEWRQLASSPNDVVRLLALRTFRSVAQPEQWLDFYRLYTYEQDPDILVELTNMVFETGRTEAATTLVEIRSRPGPPLPVDLADKLDRSIDFLTKLDPRSQ